MFYEPSYLPGTQSNLVAGSWLVLAPHADDETFGMGGAIAGHTRSGGTVDVVVLTDGARGGDSSDLVALREAEAQQAVASLGVRKLIFLRQPDRALTVCLASIEPIRALLASGEYDAVFFPSPLEPHPDHRVTAQIAWAALRAAAFPALAFSYEISVQGPCNHLVDISATVTQKQAAMRLYPSQLTQNAYVERILGLNAARAWSLPLSVSHAEAFYLWQPVDAPLSNQLWALQYAQQSADALPSDAPLVSVIVRTLNRPAMLREAIRSLAGQTHRQIELLVVNDGPLDFSNLVAEEVGGAIVAHRYLHNLDNPGRAGAANLGLRHAQGALIGFLDDDDWLLPTHLTRLVTALAATPSAVAAYAGVDAIRLNEGTEALVHRFNDPFDPLRLAFNNFMPIHSVLFRAEARAQGCAFDETLALFEDWHFWLQVARLGAFVHVPEVTAKYRIASDSGIGNPHTDRDTRQGLLAFVQAARPVWSAEQLSHLCSAAMQAVTLRAENTHLKQIETAHAEQNQALGQQIAELTDRLGILSRERAQAQRKADHLARERAFWQAQFEQVIHSRSWQLSAPLRFAGRMARQVREQLCPGRAEGRPCSLRTLLRQLHLLLKIETWRPAPHDQPSTIPSGSANLAPLVPAQIVRSPEGEYQLQDHPAGYQYIPLSRPHHLGEWLSQWQAPVLFSIVVPVYNTPPGLLTELVDSILAQWYPHWELILVDDASTDPRIIEELSTHTDARVRVIRLTQNAGIALATNAGVSQATGEFIVFADHDDLLTADALYELARCVQTDAADFLYSDEDKLDEQGRFAQPHFKPDWSPDTMMSTMFTGHLSAVRKSLFEQLGGLRSEVNGCQDWDFVLRLAEITDKISHIPKVLYHWRIIPQSVAADIAAKPYVLDASQKVRTDALVRRGVQGEVEVVSEVPGYFRVHYHPRGEPLISIIIPTRDNPKVLARCIDSIEQRSSYRRFELIVLDNGSQKPATLELLAGYEAQSRARVIRHDQPFNFSELNNLGANAAQGELLLFLNDDTEVISADWLQRMAGFAQLAHVGAVGAKLLYPDGTVQHNGVLNLADGPQHALLNSPAEAPGYFMRNLLDYNWLAVTGACLMISAEKFHAVGGFDENFPVAYNDVELCFRLVDAGRYNVVCAAVQLTHFESQTRGLDHLDPDKHKRMHEDMRRLYTKHPRYFQYDPFHNPNLHPNGVHFELFI